MQPLKLTILGEYWDSQVYSGRLYLFELDGTVTTIDWEKMISDWRVQPNLRIALSCAFSHSDYLYGRQLRLLFEDPDVKDLIQDKFEKLKQIELTADRTLLSQYRRSRQDSPFPFPHSDSHVYQACFYVSSQRGITSSRCDRRYKYGISTTPASLWDCPVLSIAMFSNAIAMAAGEEGLLEKRVGDTRWLYPDESVDKPWQEKPRTIADRHCESCEWTEYSVYGSSHSNDGFLAYFSIEGEKDHKKGQELIGYREAESDLQIRRKPSERTLKRTLEKVWTAEQIFASPGYSWASGDKIYQAANGRIHVKKFQPRAPGASNGPYTDFGTVAQNSALGDVVSAGVAVFGTVIEYDKGVVILLSDGNQIAMVGEPVRWRIFPRSRYYENQLHIIHEDRLEIWSFNQDYFVDQTNKQSGVSPSQAEGKRALLW